MAPTSATAACGNGITVNVEVKRDGRGATLVVAPVMINGQGPYTMAIDTGASLSLIDRSIMQKLKLPPAGASEPISGVGGSQQSTPVRIGTWSLGDIQLPEAQINSIALPEAQRSSGIAGLLGSDILGRFGSVTLDYSRGTLTVYQQIVTPPDATATPQARLPQQRTANR